MLADLVQHGLSAWWAPALAFGAGVISFASPCVYPLVPGYLAFVTGSREDGGRPILPILLFIVGFSAIFTALGASTWALQHIQSRLGERIAGGVIVAFGLFMLLYAFRVGWVERASRAPAVRRRARRSPLRPEPEARARARQALSSTLTPPATSRALGHRRDLHPAWRRGAVADRPRAAPRAS